MTDPLPVAGLTFHHVGVACRDLDREQAGYALLGYTPEGPDFEDPTQGVRGRFLVAPGQPRVELLVNLEGSTTLDPWLKGPARIYQQAYETPTFDDSVAQFQAVGARVVSPPVPAVAFGGRRICFVMLRTMTLVELVEAP
ncbi:VOC family protein [Kineococcus sp. GCM10028916]|uniref:VOC family protein n=1 Tax=Kineococcus sp. GCM10028916 TaxID=3273394 RepID=UPI00364258EE